MPSYGDMGTVDHATAGGSAIDVLPPAMMQSAPPSVSLQDEHRQDHDQ